MSETMNGDIKKIRQCILELVKVVRAKGSKLNLLSKRIR